MAVVVQLVLCSSCLTPMTYHVYWCSVDSFDHIICKWQCSEYYYNPFNWNNFEWVWHWFGLCFKVSTANLAYCTLPVPCKEQEMFSASTHTLKWHTIKAQNDLPWRTFSVAFSAAEVTPTSIFQLLWSLQEKTHGSDGNGNSSSSSSSSNNNNNNNNKRA